MGLRPAGAPTIESGIVPAPCQHARLDLAFYVAVQCALSENVGGAIEALMMGVPTVVSDTGGLTDAVRHNETGLVVPPDDPDALANAVVTLLSNRAYARQLATRGRALMLDRFTVARTVDDLDALYAECRAQALRGGSPSTVDGYRLTRRIARLLLLPTLALRLLPPVLRAATGDRVRSGPGLMFLAMKQVPVRAFEIVAAVFVLGLTSPYFLWKRVRRPAMPMFAKLTVSGRHGMPLVLTRFAVEPKAPWLRRLPWFLTLLTTRQLALFGPTPEPHNPAHLRARTDPAVRRRPGVICFGAKLASAEPARQPPPSQARRPS